MCALAGVRVRMVTGDNLITAIAIAKECGILEEGEEIDKYIAMEGPEFA
jgi:Ca2+-transporting ATPase